MFLLKLFLLAHFNDLAFLHKTFKKYFASGRWATLYYAIKGLLHDIIVWEPVGIDKSCVELHITNEKLSLTKYEL